MATRRPTSGKTSAPRAASTAPTPRVAVARGRPRSLRARKAILDATRALVEKGGYSSATIEAIAAKSGVAKTTIYRWWPNRAALVVDLLTEMAASAVPPPSGPDTLGALRKEMRGIAAASDDLMGRLLTSLLGEAQADPEVRAALLDRLFHPRSQATAKMIHEGQKSGRLRKDIPAHVAVDLLVGPLFYRMFVQHEPLNDAFVAQVFRTVMSGLEARRGEGRRA
jgi:AcrR family transcriptional regulator